MDSVLAIRLRAVIVNLLQKGSSSPALQPHIPSNIVYDHPSISSLAEFISTSSSPHQSNKLEEMADADVRMRVRRCVERHTATLSAPKTTDKGSKFEEGYYVVITGTTGSLGSFLLDTLLDEEAVKHVYCLNRKSSGDTYQRQLVNTRKRGLSTVKLENSIGNRMTFIDVDLSDARLGISEADYDEVKHPFSSSFLFYR
jgi:hypothetical protein